MKKIMNLLESLFIRAWQLERPLIKGLHLKSWAAGPLTFVLTAVVSFIIFTPIFALERITRTFHWSVAIHDLLYGLYVLFLFLLLVVWAIQTIHDRLEEQRRLKANFEKYGKGTRGNFE